MSVALEVLSAGPRRELLVRIAERALSAGEPDEALRCLHVAASLGTEDVRVLMLFGRAAAALGDLVAARVALDRAQPLAESGAERDATRSSGRSSQSSRPRSST